MGELLEKLYNKRLGFNITPRIISVNKKCQTLEEVIKKELEVYKVFFGKKNTEETVVYEEGSNIICKLKCFFKEC
jgi:hypothetical protein